MGKLITAKEAFDKSYKASEILYFKTNNVVIFEKLIESEESFIISMNKIFESACEKGACALAFDRQFANEHVDLLLSAGYTVWYDYGKELTFVSWEKPL